MEGRTGKRSKGRCVLGFSEEKIMDGQQFLEEFLRNGASKGIAQDTMKDGFATLVDSEGQPYVANLNPKEKERYEETKKPLSKVKKEKGDESKKEPESKKTEEKKKPETEKKGAEVVELHPEKAKEKTSLKDKIKKIVSMPFVKSKWDHTWHEFSPERVQNVLSKLDEKDEATEEALKTVEENIKNGQAAILNDTLNNISTYTEDRQGYLRSLKATERIYKNAVDFFKKTQEKLSKSVNEKEKLKELAANVKEYFGKRFKKDAKDEDVQRTIELNKEKGTLGRLSDTVGMKDDYFRIKDRANGLIEVVSKAVDEKFNPAKDKRYQLNRFKTDVSGLTSMIKNYAKANNLAMDSAEFAEIQALLNEMDNGNNSLDLFINNVNIER